MGVFFFFFFFIIIYFHIQTLWKPDQSMLAFAFFFSFARCVNHARCVGYVSQNNCKKNALNNKGTNESVFAEYTQF